MIIRGSNSAIFMNGSFVTETDSGCPRRAILRNANVDEEHGQGTLNVFALGRAFEEFYASKIPHAIREHEVKAENFVGHIDFMDDNFLYETKSVSSTNTLTHIKKGIPKWQHLFQLGAYLVFMERSHGKVVYGDYTKIVKYQQLLKLEPEQVEDLAKKEPVIYEFEVRINDDGIFEVKDLNKESDFVSTFLTVQHILDFHEQIQLLDDDELPPPPEMLPDAKYSPCHYCPLKYLCESNIQSRKEFILEAQEVLNNSI